MSTTSDLSAADPIAPPVSVLGPPAALAPTYPFPAHWTLADLQAHLGDIPLERIRLVPPPGYATEEDVVRLAESKEGCCELIDGVLVEKTMGNWESRLAVVIAYFIEVYLEKNPIGFTLGEKGSLRTVVPQVRMPDTCFVSWQKIPGAEFPKVGVLPFAPDFAIEVLSPSNTRREMARKLEEYFQGGTQLVWYVDPKARTVAVYTAVDRQTTFGENDELDGGQVLPGFRLRLADVIEKANRRPGQNK